MIRRGKSIIKNHMTLDYEFTGIRLQNGYMTPVDWTLKINLIAPGKKGKAKQDIEHSAGLAYQKLYFWLETNMPNILVVDVTNEDDFYISNLSSNLTLFCPGNPGDDMLIRLLHSKMSALSGDDLIVSEVIIKGSDTSLQYTYDCEDGNYDLPEEVEEYCPGGVKRDISPWWTRDDGFCFEFIRPEGEEDEKEVFEGIVDPMSEFHRIINEIDNHVGLVREPAKIVQVEKWKPKKVEE